MAFEPVESKDEPGAWVVEQIDHLGIAHGAKFYGLNARRRAEIYAEMVLRTPTVGGFVSRTIPAPPAVLEALQAAVDAFS